MALEVSVEETDPHLVLRASGVSTLDALRDLIDRVGAECEVRDHRRALVDLTNMSGSVTDESRYELGVHCARVWKPLLRVAFVSPMAGNSRFFETVARNRGARVAVFLEEADALAWLGVG